MDDTAIEAAILALLGERTEIYPSHIVGALRRTHPALPAARVRPALERMFAERRVARLWHRYLPPEAVGRVRAQWLAMLERQAGRLARDTGDPHAVREARAILEGWDGWRFGGEA